MAKKITLNYSRSTGSERRPTEQQHYIVTIEPHNPVTVCTISSQIDPVIEGFDSIDAWGISVCRPSDIYDYETGCRLALASALRKLDDKELRKAIWALYLEKFPVEKRQPAMHSLTVSISLPSPAVFENALRRALAAKFRDIDRKYTCKKVEAEIEPEIHTIPSNDKVEPPAPDAHLEETYETQVSGTDTELPY